MDEQQKVRTITALALAALAEAATPYGIESFDSVLKPLWKGIRQHRGKVSIIIPQTQKCDTENFSSQKRMWRNGLHHPVVQGAHQIFQPA